MSRKANDVPKNASELELEQLPRIFMVFRKGIP